MSVKLILTVRLSLTVSKYPCTKRRRHRLKKQSLRMLKTQMNVDFSKKGEKVFTSVFVTAQACRCEEGSCSPAPMFFRGPDACPEPVEGKQSPGMGRLLRQN